MENMAASKGGFGQKYTSPSRRSISPSSQTPISSMTLPSMSAAGTLTSGERRHYNRALRELCKILRLDSQRLDETMHRGIDGEVDWSRREGTLSEDVAEDEESSFRASDDIPTDSPHQLYESEDYFVPRHAPQKLPTKKKINRDDSSFYQDEPDDKMAAVQDVYAELATINRKLQKESAILHERELALMERERALVDREQASLIEQDSTLRSAQKEVGRRWAVLKEQHQNELDKMSEQLQDKTKETRRLKASFDTLKQANDALRKQLTEIQEQNKKLESQALNVQSRLVNLQRKQELSERQRALNSMSAKAKAENRPTVGTRDATEASKTAGVSKQNKPTAVYDVLGVLLEWLSDVHLRNVLPEDGSKQPTVALPAPALTKERCTKILPSLVEVLHCLPAASSKMHLPCLQFIYWSLVHLDQGQGSQPRNPLASTYRRLGEELYKPTMVRFAGVVEDLKMQEGLHEKPKAAVFFRSPNLHVRMLSCLIILKTLSQVDYLAQVFDVLRTDLKEDTAKEIYIRYQATPVVVPYLKMTHKALMSSAVDVFLQMSMESAFTQEFLESCSTDVWFRACATVLRTPNLDPKVWEKLSIILQKLSKIKTNKRHFEVQGITGIVQELLRTSSQENTFLSLNLRSILFNFNVAKRSPSAS
ncbi:coiled-coil domain-containing protein 138-like [Patiria miniata]|uniref:Coiled-coil domain-containing protein 138-like n=1 Tax=Patiria miniata TaxID=46514 RepID=A0A913ZVC0_PATMI|nr:coiled-coil domain-containing protein 138-like [Patiria miniata]XP_038055216.1 coiled-coil domain-containing protein 138-like [Patiria miniata]